MFGRKKSEVEFRGVKASNDKRSAVALFIIEAIVVLLFIAGVLFVLNFVGIISLSGINTNLFGGLPVQEKKVANTIEAQSSIPGYSLNILNKEKLIELLVSWGVYGREYNAIYSAEGNTGGVPVHEIVIHLTDIPQKANFFATDTNENYASGFTKISKGKLDVYVQLDESMLNSAEAEPPPGKILKPVIFSTIYGLANYGETGQETRNNRALFFQSFQQDPRMLEEYFVVSKEN